VTVGNNPDSTPSEKASLSKRDRRALTTLELTQPQTVRGLWHQIQFRLITLWRPRLAIGAGTLAMLASLVVMWVELSADLAVAVTGEVMLTAGALMVAYGLRQWWQWRRAKQAATR
jgi:hypothetical protein